MVGGLTECVALGWVIGVVCGGLTTRGARPAIDPKGHSRPKHKKRVRTRRRAT